MSDPQSASRRLIRFGEIEADLRAGEIRRAGARIVLPHQALRVLVRLLDRPGDVVTRDELRQDLWPDNTFVDFEHGLNSAVRRLREALGDSADTPRYVETLPRRGYRFIATIEDGPPAETPATAPVRVPVESGPAMRAISRTAVGYAVLASAAVALLGWQAVVINRSARTPGASVTPGAPADRTNLVVVSSFENRTGESALSPLGQLAADRVIGAIGRVESAEVNPEAIHAVRRDDAPEGPLEADRADAALRVAGAYYLRGNQLEFQARILDGRNGRPLYFAPSAIASKDEPTEALERLEQLLAGAVAIHFDHAFGGLDVTSGPPLLDAYLEYQAGRDLFDRDYPRALAHLERALSISPRFLLPRLTLVMAYGNLGDHASVAAQMAQIAGEVERLTKAERLLVEYMTESQARRPADALRALLEAEKLAPGSWIVNYNIQRAALVLNRPGIAIEAFDRLPLHDRHARYNAWRLSVLARALHQFGDYERELRVIRDAKEYQPGMLRYSAEEVRALAGLGRVDPITQLIDESLSARSVQGTPGDVMEVAALELRAHGHREGSLQVAARAAGWFGARSSTVVDDEADRAALARVLYLSERWEQAGTVFAALAAENPLSIEYVGYLGAIAARQGRSRHAQDISERLPGVEAGHRFGRHLYWRARIASLLGQKERAVELLREAVAQGQFLGLHIHQTPDFEQLSNSRPFVELTAPRE